MKTFSRFELLLLLLGALLLPSAVLGEEAASGVLTRAPAVLEPSEPEFPPEARSLNLAGEVALQIDISETGQVTDVRVTGPAGHGFDEAALAAARKLRFYPAEIDGKPAAVRIEYRYRFEMKEVPAPAGDAGALPPARVNLRGEVLERGTKEPLAGAMVDVGDGAFSASTDARGRFEIAGLPEGAVKVVVVENGHQRFETTETLEPGRTTEVKYYLRRSAQGAFETVVVGQKDKKEVSVVSLSVGEIRKIPGVAGDTVKVVQNLPGVARTPGGAGMLVVRGGNPDDTRIYIDGLEVPLIFHFGGLTSVYSSELSQDIEFEPGNFGVRYGRATAGRIDLKTRDPNPKRLHAVADVNLYHATALVEGPITDDLSVAVAGRRSYVDGVLNLAKSALGDDAPGLAVAPRYYDFQGKVTWKPTRRDTLRLNVFGSDDAMELVGVKTDGLRDIDILKVSDAFQVISGSWEHRFGPGSRVHLSVAEQFLQIAVNVSGTFEQRLRFASTSIRAEGTHELHPRLSLGLGVDTRLVPFSRLSVTARNPPNPNEINDGTAPPQRLDEQIAGDEAGLWAEAVWRPFDGLVLVPGLRWDYSRYIVRSSWVDPRLNARWTLREGTTIKGGIGLYHQPPPVVEVTRQWGNPDLREEGSRQYGLGVEQKIWGPLSLDLELYYKDLFHLAVPSDRAVTRGGLLVPERFANTGTGKAYGAELLLRYNPDRHFFGWIAYSISRTTRSSDNGTALRQSGDQFDQPHNLVALGTLELPEVWNGLSVGFRLRTISGNPFKRIVRSVYDVDLDRFNGFTGTETGRAPTFFQLDLRVDKAWTFKTWAFSAYLDVQNVTNRSNPEGVAYSHDFTEQGWTTGLPIFPSLGLRAEY